MDGSGRSFWFLSNNNVVCLTGIRIYGFLVKLGKDSPKCLRAEAKDQMSSEKEKFHVPEIDGRKAKAKLYLSGDHETIQGCLSSF